jgi:CRISPR system Cascade subunit CasC
VGAFKWDELGARKTAEDVLSLFLSKELPKAKKSKKGAEEDARAEKEDTSTLLYFSPEEILKIAGGIHEAKQKKDDVEPKALKDAAIKTLGKGMPKDAADIAVFGRMVANAPDVTLEGAGMFSHALSTHKCDNDLDFWTAVEDEKKVGDDAGAANMGTAEFNSACYYRYAAINLDLMFDASHLATLEPAQKKQVVDAFIRATLLAVPGARKNSMNANTPPVYVLGVVKEQGQPIQLINAFEKPAKSKQGEGLVEISVERMKQHHEDLKKTWGIKTVVEVAIPETSLDKFCEALVAHV